MKIVILAGGFGACLSEERDSFSVIFETVNNR